jgi:hypothetical protein
VCVCGGGGGATSSLLNPGSPEELHRWMGCRLAAEVYQASLNIYVHLTVLKSDPLKSDMSSK